MRSGKRFAGFVAVLFLVLLLVFWFRNANAPLYTDLTYQDMQGETHAFAKYEGQPLLLIFWATDCPSCVTEIDDLNALHEKYTDEGLAMLAISLPHDRPEHILAMQAERNMIYPLTWDHDGEISRAFNNVRVTPTHYLIDERGSIVMRKIGVLDFEQLENRLNRMGLNPA